VPVGEELQEMVAADVARAARLVESGLWTFTSAVSAPGDRQQLDAAGVAAQRVAKRVSTALRKARADRRNAPTAGN
jgi:hypothetical protein